MIVICIRLEQRATDGWFADGSEAAWRFDWLVLETVEQIALPSKSRKP